MRPTGVPNNRIGAAAGANPLSSLRKHWLRQAKYWKKTGTVQGNGTDFDWVQKYLYPKRNERRTRRAL